MRPGLWQILLVIVLVFILFGSNKIPDMMKNLAGGVKVFKKELKDDDSARKPASKKTSHASRAVAKQGKRSPVRGDKTKK